MKAAERREVIERSAAEVFAERGYHGASMEEIARRAGVTPPVLYDHFASKLDLHKRLLERTRGELLEMWRTSLAGGDPAEVRIPRALGAWADYVKSHPYAPRMYFFETTGVPEAKSLHDEIQAEARVALAGILGGEAGSEHLTGSDEARDLEMAAEVMRSGLAGLAIWWADHPEVSRDAIVATAVNVIWLGFDRVRRGQGVPPPS